MITVTPDTFRIARTFTISRGSKTHAHVLTVRITRGGLTGWGECVPYARYGESLESVTAAILALPEGITLYRPGKQASEPAPLSALVSGASRVNFALEEGDVIYVPSSGMARAGYVMRQILPGFSFLTSTAALVSASQK